MTRIRQFAKDMGMSYNQANNLVNKGRALKDGGSSVLENTMNKAKPIKAKNGKSANFPDLTGDGKVTRADVLKGRGVFKTGGTLKMRDGGAFRGCGAQVKGKKFKGIF